ncbi:MAG: hypothetical protein PHN35_01100 [Clostridia bacterium]|nr:hypothetical protein [Clostridia bacterium]
MSNTNKVYVAVKACFETDGQLKPYAVIWEDGHEFLIDRVLGVCRAASLKAGGAGIRYTVRIGSRETYLFLEENRWFVERK